MGRSSLKIGEPRDAEVHVEFVRRTASSGRLGEDLVDALNVQDALGRCVASVYPPWTMTGLAQDVEVEVRAEEVRSTLEQGLGRLRICLRWRNGCLLDHGRSRPCQGASAIAV